MKQYIFRLLSAVLCLCIGFLGFPIWWYNLPMPAWTFLEIYLGHTVNYRTTVVSYKDKRVIDRPVSNTDLKIPMKPLSIR